MILPAKSIICMPCHAATFSARDVNSILGLVGLALGICAVASVWFTGAPSGRSIPSSDLAERAKTSFGLRAVAIVKALCLDGLLQRRLFLRSPQRWLIHGLIFWPFVVRFSWGIVALVGSFASPGYGWVWHMLDKNYPLTAFVFDFTGLMIVFGVLLAIFRKRLTGSEVAVSGLPDRDWLAAGLLLAIVVVGFLLEGARIALTQATGGASFAFVGWALSLLWRGESNLSEIYGYIWYSHAILTAAFLVYLPFSGMFHMIMAPVVMALNATDNSRHDTQQH
jgi:nitrate reductase gamma subunit